MICAAVLLTSRTAFFSITLLISPNMKRILFTLAALFILSAASAQRKELRQFTNDFAEIGETHRLGLSFLPLRIVSWFVPRSAWDGDAAYIKLALKKVRSVKLYTIQLQEGQPIPAQSIALLKENLKKGGNFEPLMEMRHKGSNIFLLSDGKNDERLDNLVVLIQDDEEMTMAHLRTRLTINDVSRVINKLQEHGQATQPAVEGGSGDVAKQP